MDAVRNWRAPPLRAAMTPPPSPDLRRRPPSRGTTGGGNLPEQSGSTTQSRGADLLARRPLGPGGHSRGVAREPQRLTRHPRPPEFTNPKETHSGHAQTSSGVHWQGESEWVQGAYWKYVPKPASGRRRYSRKTESDHLSVHVLIGRVSVVVRRRPDDVQARRRRGRDSNPRYGYKPHTPLAGERLQPLGHLSGPLDSTDSRFGRWFRAGPCSSGRASGFSHRVGSGKP